MGTSTRDCLIPELSERPTSVFVHGSNRPLLNWVLYAILVRADPDYLWTDVRFSGEVLDSSDPLARKVVPESRLSVVPPEELRVGEHPPRAAWSALHPDEDPDAVRRVADFLRLPPHTQEMIARVRRSGRTPLLGISNGHRLVGLYPIELVEPTLKSILDSGVSMVMTWADAVPGGSSAFDFVLGVEGSDPEGWKEATLRCALGTSRGRVRAGRSFCLADLPPVAEELSRIDLSGPVRGKRGQTNGGSERPPSAGRVV